MNSDNRSMNTESMQPEEKFERVESRRSNIQRVLDLEVPVTVSFGFTSRPLKELLKLAPGAVLELNRATEDLVVMKVNNKVIARGEVVVVDGYYGIRIREIDTAAERIASLGGTV